MHTKPNRTDSTRNTFSTAKAIEALATIRTDATARKRLRDYIATLTDTEFAELSRTSHQLPRIFMSKHIEMPTAVERDYFAIMLFKRTRARRFTARQKLSIEQERKEQKSGRHTHMKEKILSSLETIAELRKKNFSFAEIARTLKTTEPELFTEAPDSHYLARVYKSATLKA